MPAHSCTGSQASSAQGTPPRSPQSSRPTTPTSGSEDGEGFLGLDASSRNANRKFILVIGGLGFIGSHTSLELLKAGHSVVIVDNLSNSFESVFSRIQMLAAHHYREKGGDMPALHLHKIDYQSKAMQFLLDMYSISEGFKPQQHPGAPDHQQPAPERQSRIRGVIHFAAYKSVSESISRPIQYYRNNVCGLVDLVELLGEYNIRTFVFSSSATVYGSKADQGRPLREEDLVHHTEEYVDGEGRKTVAEPKVVGLQSPYARSKYFCEAILADIARSDSAWHIVCLRYFNPVGCDSSGLLGEDPKGIPTNLFPVITQVLTGSLGELSIFGSDWDTRDGTPVRDFVHVSDVARGHIAALASDVDAPFRTYNLGSGTGTTVVEAVQSLEAAARRPIPVSRVGRRDGDVGFCVASNGRAARELGWTARESIPKCAEDLWRFVSKAQAEAT
ncbi:NAD dependent epimerase/dehydratase family protein [Hirsutella rhossiliensis]|uniref:NAD dependent epimerase/dehydratase family domain-containing protein n=1 Tax=Hirsutella rhossiliensis TaxID=111463 RepID=A0A9P8N266_9HYPO|nr:NAD dependent epimerase/dehydratase family domain-containing protein [Hirsutella rhossiliensis]KAH0965520.1 NAD dependent epimerase/dehydratase family domain-containing protein [Hirsutella rhossiliensis]